MEIIINDFSLDGQFTNTDEFLDSLNDVTIPILERLEDLKVKVLSSYTSYELLVTEKKTLYDMMAIKGSGEIRKFKRLLQELLFDDPYWNEDMISINEIYDCDFTKNRSGFCLAEALERKIPVLSFEHDKFKHSLIRVNKNSEENNVKNLFNQEILLGIFREDRVISHFDFIIFKYNMNESFGLQKGKNYFDELVKSAALSEGDIEVIVNDIEKLIYLTDKGLNPGRLSDTFDDGLKEFRTSLSDKREIRIFYFEKSRKLIFMNGYLKKDQKASTLEVDRARKIMKTY